MCDYMVQAAPPHAYLSALGPSGEPSERDGAADEDAAPRPRGQGQVIKPQMRVSAILDRGQGLECLEVRWGWSPVWSMSIRPLTVLPLDLVMRSKGFARLRSVGRALVAVDGWYEAPSDAAGGQRFTYTTPRFSGPVYFAALAQISEPASGCDGLALISHGGGAGVKPRMLAFGAEHARAWLTRDLDWEQAHRMTAECAIAEPQLEYVLSAPRPSVRAR